MSHKPVSPLYENLESVRREVEGARGKWPGNAHKLAALVEEVGELAQALLRHDDEGGSGAAVYREAIQVAAMALRIAEEGDAGFSYRYEIAHVIGFRATGEGR